MSGFGDMVRARRLALRVSLRAFCLENGFDPSNWSKVERGRLPPPQGDQLRRCAEALGLAPETAEWRELFDTAAAEAGRIPPDLLDGEVAAKLPVLFRTLRESVRHGGDDDTRLLEELKRKIREA